MREKLIKLLDDFSAPVMLMDTKLMDWKIPTQQLREAMADYLIANGVTIPVRCKDCVYYREEELVCIGVSCIDDSHANWYPDDFCSYGERKDNGIDKSRNT